MEKRLEMLMRASGVMAFLFRRVPSDYYERPFEERRDILGSSSSSPPYTSTSAKSRGKEQNGEVAVRE
jgi:hypothetical protein